MAPSSAGATGEADAGAGSAAVPVAERKLGLFGAVTVGVGAIVGGGVIVLAGSAFAVAGPSTAVAFLLNGVVALMTAVSYAEMVSAFPESGGTYAYARKVLSVRLAFATGWVVWLAYILAGVLYALGFGTFAVATAVHVCRTVGIAEGWEPSREAPLGAALLAIAAYTASLFRSSTGGGIWATWGKVVVFGLLVVGGVVYMALGKAPPLQRTLLPFFSGGALGVVQVMGLTFIFLQGFEVIATVAGEIDDAPRRVPRAMFLALGVSVAVYVPLLLVLVAAGTSPGTHIHAMAQKDPDTLFAVAVRNYLGPPGYWLVMVAALMATLSALHANLLAASRIALRMAQDRTLPWVFGVLHKTRGTPVTALLTSGMAMGALLLMASDLASAGAAASLIFLVSFAFAHGMSYLARRRGDAREGAFRSPWFPVIPVVGGLSCAGLALFQALTVLSAGVITLLWLGIGTLLYVSLFGERAKVADAAAEAHDTHLTQLRGRTPVLLVPLSNPDHASSMAQVAAALLPVRSGKLWFLSIVPTKLSESAGSARLDATERAIRRAIVEAVGQEHRPETLITVADEAWGEIARVARERGVGGILLGLGDLDHASTHRGLESLGTALDCDLTVLRAPAGFRLQSVSRIVVPMHPAARPDELRARLLGSLQRLTRARVTYLYVAPPDTAEPALDEARRTLTRLAGDEVRGEHDAEVVGASDLVPEIGSRAGDDGLVVLTLRRPGKGGNVFGKLAQELSRRSPAGLLMIGRGR